MATLEEIRKTRLEKLAILKKKGLEPYPISASADRRSLADVAENFSKYEKKEIVIAGRIMAIRGQGGLIFFTLQDGSGKFQGLLKKDESGEAPFQLFAALADIGDFIEAGGTIFVTKRGGKTLLVKSWRILSKSLRPLPEKWHGLQDTEARYRHRYLDLLLNPELKTMFARKAAFWSATREFLQQQGFLEVETPTLEITTGGAEARPFKTHHNDFDLDLYLRISVGELWQKRLMAAGFEKTFEIGRVYRNEGTSAEHLQEFTNMEFYWAYAGAKEGMKLCRELYIAIAKKVYGKTKFEARGFKFDLADEWPEIDYAEEIKKQIGLDITKASDTEIKNKLNELGIAYKGENRERLLDTLWKHCRKTIAGPAFLVGHPKIVAPLSKSNPQAPEKTEMFQPLIAGSEVGRGYSELNDPLEQRTRFDEQKKLLAAGDEEAMMPDEEFVEMLEYGMPPACGFGFGERLFAILEDKPLRETQLFPLMRSKI
ncbi:MAG: lysine--tRNA ligase [Patescibacteria group bacterium]